MTACAIEAAAQHEDDAAGPPQLTIAADGSYAARLAGEGEALYPERWTLDGPEPYAVPLPLDQPEERDTQLLPLADGRVLVARRVAGRFAFSLLYPAGPGTGELPLGAVEAESVRLLPPPPDGSSVYALVAGERSSGIWQVAGGAFGPEHVAEVRGRCTGGAWLDRSGRLLSLDREQDDGGPVKAVAVDLERGGEVTPLLQITDESHDRLLLADPDSGLLLIRSDAPSPGRPRLGWGVLGSARPVRFPECLRAGDASLTPFAVQPGQVLTPEGCAVALRMDAAAGRWIGVWRPAARRLVQLPAPEGWFAGAGTWTPDGVLLLPYATATVPCGLARVEGVPEALVPDVPKPTAAAPREECPAGGPSGEPAAPAVCRPVPLQQAPLTGRAAPG
ncbi:hypothetical protein BJP40_21155 [Streptomyces sp. CC53]|uniref:hypothetical protein n=1 Tax=unclassified Streptomyces TaxID=2593676 RepID=UPI0008DCE403|nr:MULTISPECIES: hypothetical protein [unclassified Streptomyces]OII64199.1 hypothetical protein BJP40_21155 [Streptomyces sp. CC53]